jgi:hypothetical protein
LAGYEGIQGKGGRREALIERVKDRSLRRKADLFSTWEEIGSVVKANLACAARLGPNAAMFDSTFAALYFRTFG